MTLFRRLSQACPGLALNITLTSGAFTVTTNLFNENAYSKVPTFDPSGYRLYSTAPGYKITADLALTDAQVAVFRNLYNNSISTWGAGGDGTITVTDAVEPPTITARKFTFTNPPIIKPLFTSPIYHSVQIELEYWAETGDSGVQSISLNGNSFSRFNTWEKPSRNQITASRSVNGTQIYEGLGYTVPITWQAGLLVNRTELTTLETTLFQTNATAISGGGTTGITLVDGIYGGTHTVVMGNFGVKSVKVGQFEASFTLTKVV